MRRITSLAHRLNPRIHIIVRTRYVTELQPLFELGANDVVPEEFETSVAVFTLVLRKYLVAKEQIEHFVTQVRADGYLVDEVSPREPDASTTVSDTCTTPRSAPSA